MCVCEVGGGGGGGVFPSCLECMSCARERDVKKKTHIFYNLIMFCRNQSRQPGRP